VTGVALFENVDIATRVGPICTLDIGKIGAKLNRMPWPAGTKCRAVPKCCE